ncbi:MAG: DUF4124 domain-containing protein [Ramlibacter sp.]|nr:DUF4124 domain-containing protein [Ramlibacter sp.]MCW5648273.1 DUF4124 domain-containing protein [Ramlibacter sp.]
MKMLKHHLLGLALWLPLIASAQWIWIDKDGKKVFSDRPPPAEIPAKSVLKQPDAKSARQAIDEGKAQPVAAAPKMSGKDKDLMEKKKKLEAAEAEKKAAEDEKIAKAKADNCARATQAKVTYESGVRVAKTNEKGERIILDDSAKDAEIVRIKEIIAQNCLK